MTTVTRAALFVALPNSSRTSTDTAYGWPAWTLDSGAGLNTSWLAPAGLTVRLVDAGAPERPETETV